MVSQSYRVSRSCRWFFLALMIFVLIAVAILPALSAKRSKYETIEATAMGTGTQLGQTIGVSLEIYEFSTPEDRQVLVDAFMKGQNQGLVNALTKMRAVGHCSITGTIGYDVSFVKMTPTSTGREIRFVRRAVCHYGIRSGFSHGLNAEQSRMRPRLPRPCSICVSSVAAIPEIRRI